MSPLPASLRALAAAALLVAVGGCELFKDNEEVQATVNRRVLGKPVGEFFDRYGRATASTEIGNSTAIYNWISDRGMTRPGPEGQDERVCKLRLTVDKTGKISDVQILYDAQGTKSSFALRRDLRRAVGACAIVAELRAARPGDEVAIVGAGIGGLTLALALHRARIACRVYEAAAEIRPLGVGINVLPHASAALASLGVLADARARRRRHARGGVLQPLRPARLQRAGRTLGRPRRAAAARSTAPTCRRSCSTPCANGSAPIASSRVTPASRVDGVDDARVRLRFHDPAGAPNGDAMAAVAVGCDGIHSALRKQLYPDEGPPRWSGVNMWRGVVAACAVPERRDDGPRRLARRSARW